MNYIALIALVVILVYSWSKEKNAYNPVFIFCGIWFLVTLLSTINYYDLIEVSDKAYGLALLGIICFSIGALIRNGYKVVISKRMRFSQAYKDDINYSFLIPFYAFALVFTVYFALRSFAALRRGILMETIRFNYKDFNTGIIMTSGWQYSIEHYIIATAEFAAVAILPIVITERKSTKKYVFLAELTLFLILHMFVTGARSFLIEVAVVLLFYFMMNKDVRAHFRDRVRKIPKFAAFLIAVGAIGMVILMTQIRKGDKSLMREIYNYFAISYPLLDIHLDLMKANPEYTYGMTLLNGALRPFLVVLKNIGIPYPALYQKAVDLMGANDTFYAVGKGSANSFVTAFYYFFMDFGVISVVMGCLLYGYISKSLYNKLHNCPSKCNQAMYLLLALGLFLTFVRLQFTAHRYLYAFLILSISFKSSEKMDAIIS